LFQNAFVGISVHSRLKPLVIEGAGIGGTSAVNSSRKAEAASTASLKVCENNNSRKHNLKLTNRFWLLWDRFVSKPCSDQKGHP
jgi:hypothetical protein